MKLCPRHSLAILAFSAALVIGSGTMGAEAPAEPKCTGDAVNPTVCWIFRATMAWRPAYSMGALPKLGIAAESIDQHTDRRRAIASAVWEAVSIEDPLPMGGATDKENRQRSAVFVASIMNHESAYHLLVQRYHCKGLDPSYCDSGAAWCLGQVHVGKSPDAKALGWSGPDLDADPVKCARVVVLTLARWAKACPKGTGADRFSGYAMGECGVSPKVRVRWAPAESWWKGHAAP